MESYKFHRCTRFSNKVKVHVRQNYRFVKTSSSSSSKTNKETKTQKNKHIQLTLQRNSIHRIIRKIRPGLIRTTRRTRTLPPTNINTTQMRCHLYDLDGIQGSKGMRVAFGVVEVGEKRVEFARGAVGVG